MRPAKTTPEMRCSMCGVRLQRKRFNGRLEDYGAFKKRRFCSLSCANSRTKGGLSRKAFHAQARKYRKTACECCGGKARLQVHHINEDWTDNRPTNLQTLCVFCHQFWHATHRRHGVKPSTPMPPMPFLSQLMSQAASDGCVGTVTPSSRSSRRPSSKPISTSGDDHEDV